MAASDIHREDVLKAIAEFDRLGQKGFLKRYDFGEALQYRLVHEGKFYDSKAIAGVAHGYATGDYWTKAKPFGGTAPGGAVTILENLGFFVDRYEFVNCIRFLLVNKSHGQRAPYQYIVLLWAISRARNGEPRLTRFSAVNEELTDLLAPFALSRTIPDPAMPWAALYNNGVGGWELPDIKMVGMDDGDVRVLDPLGGLPESAYAEVQTNPAATIAAMQVIGGFIGSHPAYPALIQHLGLPDLEKIGRINGGPEVEDAVEAIEEVVNPRRKFGRRLSAAENKAIEEQAVRVVRKHYKEVLGYGTEDVGATKSYDVHATKGDSVIKVEVKGTTSDGSEIILTANEVALHLAEHPNTALAVVRRIVLDRSGVTPVGTGGELKLMSGWELDESRLKPIVYRYPTGL
jgi:hypothetical protein